MYYIRLSIGGDVKYLYNWRCAVFLPDYARRFSTLTLAIDYMKDKQVAKEQKWWIEKGQEPDRWL